MLSILVAMDKNHIIGKDNQLPWHLPEDLAYFKRMTMGHTIIMGRKTFESIGKPLPGRKNIVVTRNNDYHPCGCEVIHSLNMIQELSRKEDEIFLIGGAELFKETLAIADRLYITKIEASFDGDTFFPEFVYSDWKLISKEKGLNNAKNPYDYYFSVYVRTDL
jgi:dihydrofolate reductase